MQEQRTASWPQAMPRFAWEQGDSGDSDAPYLDLDSAFHHRYPATQGINEDSSDTAFGPSASNTPSAPQFGAPHRSIFAPSVASARAAAAGGDAAHPSLPPPLALADDERLWGIHGPFGVAPPATPQHSGHDSGDPRPVSAAVSPAAAEAHAWSLAEVRNATAPSVRALQNAVALAAALPVAVRRAPQLLPSRAPRVNAARAKWGSVAFDDAGAVAFHASLTKRLLDQRFAMAQGASPLSLPAQVPDEALAYAEPRHGSAWEMFDASKHADFDAFAARRERRQRAPVPTATAGASSRRSSLSPGRRGAAGSPTNRPSSPSNNNTNNNADDLWWFPPAPEGVGEDGLGPGAASGHAPLPPIHRGTDPATTVVYNPGGVAPPPRGARAALRLRPARPPSPPRAWRENADAATERSAVAGVGGDVGVGGGGGGGGGGLRFALSGWADASAALSAPPTPSPVREAWAPSPLRPTPGDGGDSPRSPQRAALSNGGGGTFGGFGGGRTARVAVAPSLLKPRTEPHWTPAQSQAAAKDAAARKNFGAAASPLRAAAATAAAAARQRSASPSPGTGRSGVVFGRGARGRDADSGAAAAAATHAAWLASGDRSVATVGGGGGDGSPVMSRGAAEIAALLRQAEQRVRLVSCIPAVAPFFQSGLAAFDARVAGGAHGSAGVPWRSVLDPPRESD